MRGDATLKRRFQESTQCYWCTKHPRLAVPKRSHKLYHEEWSNYQTTRKLQKDMDKLKEKVTKIIRYGINSGTDRGKT